MRAVGVMDFAGGFACGVQQAGFDYVAKREPSAFGGFGVTAIEANFQGVQIEVSEPEFWSMVQADMIFGCPPCSGFSMLSTINTADSKTGKMVDGVRVAQRGVDSPDNRWMRELVSYAAKVKPEVVIFESVPSGGKLGAPLMSELWELLKEESGLDYHHTDVFMNAALVGGDVIRPRYFWVSHLRPFGVDLPTGRPRTLMEVIGDLPLEAGTRLDEGEDLNWGHVTNGSSSDARIRATIEEFRAHGYDWAEGKRLPEHLEHWVTDLGHEYPAWWYGKNGELLSHAVSDNMYSPFRWRENKPMGVVTGGFMDRAVHPLAARTFTYREGARFMGLPDDWSLYPIVGGKKDSWLGKAIPVASGRWIATWAAASMNDEPGEYAGVEIGDGHRVIDVTTPDKVRAIDSGQDGDVWWARPVSPRWFFVERLSQSVEGPEPVIAAAPTRAALKTAARPSRTTKVTREAPSRTTNAPITRIRPETFLAKMTQLGLSRQEAAQAMGVSPSRVAELTGTSRPNSWLNSVRWEEVQIMLEDFAGARIATA